MDPESDELLMVEWHAREVLEAFPEAQVTRTRDVFQFDIDGDEGVVLLITAEAVELRLPTVEWTKGAHAPKCGSRLWRRLSWKKAAEAGIANVVMEAMRKRRSEFHKCRYCGELVPVEHRYDGNTCHGCASKHLGVVY